MNTPLLDKRDYKDLIEEMKKIVPNFTPEWNFDINNPDVGSTLFMVFAMQLKETIDMLNRSMNKNYTSFLNMSNVVIKPTKVSKAPVVFTLTSDDVSVFLEKGTRLTTTAGENINFETENDLVVVPMKINNCYFANDMQDKIIKAGKENISMFDYDSNVNIQKHEIYLAQDNLLNIESNSRIILKFEYSKYRSQNVKRLKLLCDSKLVKWEYYAENDEFIQFDNVYADDNCIILEKSNNIKLLPYEGLNSRVIRISLNEKHILKFYDLLVDMLSMQTESSKESDDGKIRTDMMFNNDTKLKKDDIKPYGYSFNPSDYFYIGCDEVFTKQKSSVSIDMDIDFVDDLNKKVDKEEIKWKLIMKKSTLDTKTPTICSIKDIDWYYYNGLRWEPLNVNNESSNTFYCVLDDEELSELTKDIAKQNGKDVEEFELQEKLKSTYADAQSKIEQKASLLKLKKKNDKNENKNIEKVEDTEEQLINKTRKKVHKTISFVCPSDFSKVDIGGESGYFIRAEIRKVENNYEYNAVSMVPVIQDLYIKYNYMDRFIVPDKMLTINNNEEKIYTYELQEQSNTIKPFYGVNSTEDMLYVCLNRQVETGPVNMLFIIDKTSDLSDDTSIKIEYYTIENGEKLWREISIKDETNGLTKTGIITLVGLNKFTKKIIFGEEGYWLRISINNKNVDTSRLIKKIYFNGVWASQQISVKDEHLELDVETNQYKLFNTPILDMDLYVDEISMLNKSEMESIITNNDEDYKQEYDSMGILKEFWIKWREVDTFINCQDHDRVYIIDRQTGIVQFGNNINGKKPPVFNKSIKVNYKYGGGNEGNLNVNSINGLYEGKAFIDKVFNPIQSTGGVDAECVNEAVNRVSRGIRHRDKAVSIKDIESMVLDNFKDIQDVKCITNKSLAFTSLVPEFVSNKTILYASKKTSTFVNKNGHICVVVLPTDNKDYIVSDIIKARVKEFLADKVPSVMTEDKLHVLDARPIKINIDVTVLCDKKENPYYIKSEIENKLDAFLDITTGNFNHTGWQIGEIPKRYGVYSVISKIDGAKTMQIKNMTVSYVDDNNMNPVEMNVETAEKVLNGIIEKGKYNINIVINNN